MEKIDIWKEPFKVRSYHMDMKARATIMSIAGYLQEVAGNHADHMHFGFRHMKESGLTWLLTRVKIVVHKYPIWNDNLEVSTWVVNAEKFFSRRDFEITDKSGNILVSAISGWMLVNAKEKKPHSVEEIKDRFSIFPDKRSINEDIQKIEAISRVDSSSEYQVKYSDIDVVNHVNNIQYYNIILDSLPSDFRKQYHVQSFEINYLAEALIDEELEILTQNINHNQEFLHEIKRAADQKILCRALVKWVKD